VTGYGKTGPWKNRPGQDLLLQSMSGLVYTSGNEHDNPIPFGIAIADIICGAHLVQGILAALVRRRRKGIGALIELSLIESLLDFQFELLTTYFASKQLPKRSAENNAHPLLSAPYGIYSTSDGFIAIAMVSIQRLALALGSESLAVFAEDETFSSRDEIKNIISKHVSTATSAFWIEKLHNEGIWAMEILDWNKIKEHPAYKVLQMEQTVRTGNGKEIITTRCPIRINGERLFSGVPAPELGANNKKIIESLSLKSIA